VVQKQPSNADRASISMAVLVSMVQNFDKNLDKRKNVLYKPAKIYSAGGANWPNWRIPCCH
jgi:hypothetical protein